MGICSLLWLFSPLAELLTFPQNTKIAITVINRIQVHPRVLVI